LLRPNDSTSETVITLPPVIVTVSPLSGTPAPQTVGVVDKAQVDEFRQSPDVTLVQTT